MGKSGLQRASPSVEVCARADEAAGAMLQLMSRLTTRKPSAENCKTVFGVEGADRGAQRAGTRGG